MKIKLKLKLMDQFLIIYSILIIIPLSILFGYTYSKMSKLIKENILTSTEQAFNQSLSFISYKMDRIYSTADAISVDDKLTNLLVKDYSNYDIHEEIKDLSSLRSYLYSYQNNIDISTIELYVNDSILASNDMVNIFPLSRLNNSRWLNIVNDKNERYLCCPHSYISQSNKNYICLGKKIVDPNDYSNFIACLFINFSKSDLEEIIKHINSIDGGVSFIVNSNDDIIAGSDYSLYEKYKDIINSPYDNEHSSYINNNLFIQTADIDKTDWRIINIVPYNAVSMEINNQKVYLLIIVLIFGGSSLVIGYKFFNSINKRLSKVINGMRDVRADNLNNFIENDKDDELGELIVNYNYMISKMSKLIDDQYKLGKAVKNAELKALQSQINPHFLYNTLDMINWLAYKNKTSEISTAVKSLAKFYKLSLNKGKDMTYIKDDLEHVSLYVKIQNMRYSDRISLEINVDEEIADCIMPKITLQPIVENAINHGILARGNVCGKITITGSVFEDNIILNVADDGIGIEKEKLPLLLSSDNLKTSGSGYGLKNIDQRLKLLFGDIYGLSFYSVYGSGTTVSITIPKVHDLKI